MDIYDINNISHNINIIISSLINSEIMRQENIFSKKNLIK